MKVSKYYIEKLNKAKIEKFGNEEKQIENAREFLLNDTPFLAYQSSLIAYIE